MKWSWKGPQRREKNKKDLAPPSLGIGKCIESLTE